MPNLDPLGVIFTAKDLASATLGKLQNQFQALDKEVQGTVKGFTQGMSIIGAGMGVMGIGAATLAPLGIGIKLAGDFQAQLINIKKLAGDGADMPTLEKAFLNMGPSLGQTAEDLAKIGAAGAALGITATKDMLGFTEGVSMMSVALDMSAEQAGDQGAKMLNAFKLPIDQIQNLGSAINTMADSTAASSRDIIEASFRAASSVHALGGTASQVAALTASLVEVGLPAEIAGTSLRRMFDQSVGAPKKLAQAMGISVDVLQQRMGKDAVGTLMSFMKQLSLIPNAAIRVGTAAKVFGEDGAKAANALSQNVEKVTLYMDQAAASFKDGTGMLKEFKSQSQGFNFSINALKSAFGSLFTTLGMALLPILTPIMKGITSMIQTFTELIQPIRHIVAGAIAFVGGFLLAAGAIMILKGSMIAISGVLTLIGLKMSVFVAVFAQAALIVAALGVAFYVLRKAYESNFGGFGDFVRNIFDKVSAFVRAFIDVLANGEISGELYEQLQKTGMLEFTEAVLRAWFRAKAFLGGVLDGFISAWKTLEPIATAVIQGIMFAFEMLGKAVIWVVDWIDKLTGGKGNQDKNIATWTSWGQIIGKVAGYLSIAFVAFKAIGIAMTVLGAVWAVVSSPIVIGIAAIAAAAWLAYEAFNWMKEVWPSIQAAASRALDSITGALNALGMQEIIGAWSAVWDLAVQVTKAAWNVISMIIGTAWDYTFGLLIKGVSYVIGFVWNIVIGFFRGWIDGFKSTFATIGAAFGDAGGVWGQVFGKLWTIAKNVFTILVNGFKAAWSMAGLVVDGVRMMMRIFTAVVKVVANVVRWFNSLFGIQEKSTTQIKDFGDAAAWVGSIFGKVFGTVITILGTMFGMIGRVVLAVLSIPEAISGAFATLSEFMSNPGDAIRNFATMISTNLGNAFSGGITGIGSLLGGIATAFAPVWEAVKTGFINAFVAIKDSIVGIFSSIGSTIVSSLTSGLSQAGAIGSKIVDFFSGGKPQAQAAGSNVIPFPPGGRDGLSGPKAIAPTPLVAPTAGLRNQDLGVGAQVTAAGATANAVRQASDKQDSSNSGQPQTIVVQTMLDGRKVAESVNKVNDVDRRRAGGIK